MPALHLAAANGDPLTIYYLPRTNPSAFKAWTDFVRSDTIFGLDVETTEIDEEAGGIFAPAARMRTIQIANAHEAWVLDPSDEGWRTKVAYLLESADAQFVSHTNYDVLWVRREFGIQLDEPHDTYVLAALLRPGPRRNKGLKWLVNEYLGEPSLGQAEDDLTAAFKLAAPKGQRVGRKLKAWGFTNFPIDDPTFARYAGLDAIFVRRLAPVLWKELRELEMVKLARTERTVAHVCADLRWRGVRLDVGHTEALLSDLEAEYAGAERVATERLGCNPRGARARSEALEALGVDGDRTNSGFLQVTKETIPALLARSIREMNSPATEALEALQTMSERSNLINNLRVMLTQAAIGGEGIVHPTIKSLAAQTGRMSISSPAMQTYKKTDKRLRNCFIARDGFTLIGADYDSQEIRVAAALSGDELMNKVVSEGINQHDATAASIFGDGFTKSQRQIAKTLNFAIQYGAGPKKIGESLGIPYFEARQLWSSWRSSYKGLVDWSDRLAQFEAVRNPFGRVIPSDPFRSYANGNYAIQSSGRDILGIALRRLYEQNLSRFLWLMIHDEIILEIPDESEQATAHYLDALEQAMCVEMVGPLGRVDVTASAEVIGHRWGGS